MATLFYQIAGAPTSRVAIFVEEPDPPPLGECSTAFYIIFPAIVPVPTQWSGVSRDAYTAVRNAWKGRRAWLTHRPPVVSVARDARLFTAQNKERGFKR
jgi:hypothetical protein